MSGSRPRYVLALALVTLSLWATLHFARVYAGQHLYLGLFATLALGALLAAGAASFVAARRRLSREWRAFAGAELTGKPGAVSADTLLGRRQARLLALRERGGRPDLAALSGSAAAEVGGHAYLGRYFVAVAVLVGLLGTFAGLMETLGGVSGLLQHDSGQTVQSVLLLLAAPLSGLNVTFGASIVGILVTVTLSLLQGDLGLAEDHLLAALEEHTAHVILPSLWPVEKEPVSRLLAELAGLRGELGDKVRHIEELQRTTLDQMAARAAAQLAAFEQHSQTRIAEYAGSTAETLRRFAAEGAEQLDTRLRRGDEALSAHAERTAGVVAQMVRDLQGAEQRSVTARDQELVSLGDRLGASLQRSVAELSQRVEVGAAQAVAASVTAAERVAQAAATLLGEFQQGSAALLRGMDEAAVHTSQAVVTAASESSERSAQAAAEAARQAVAAAEQAAGTASAAAESSASRSATASEQAAQKASAAAESAASRSATAAEQAAQKASAAAESSAIKSALASGQAAEKAGAAAALSAGTMTDSSAQAAARSTAAAEQAADRMARSLEDLTGRLGAAVEQALSGTAASTTAAIARAAAASEQSAEKTAAAAEQSATRSSAAAAAAVEQTARSARDTESRVLSAVVAAIERVEVASTTAAQQTAQANGQAAAEIGRYAAALLAGEGQRSADHEALRQRLEDLLERGIAAPVAEHLRSWQEAARTAQHASESTERSSAALQEAARSFAGSSAALGPCIDTLGPELSALAAEVALLAARSESAGVAPAEQLLTELIRLTDTIAQLDLRLGERPAALEASHAPPEAGSQH